MPYERERETDAETDRERDRETEGVIIICLQSCLELSDYNSEQNAF